MDQGLITEMEAIVMKKVGKKALWFNPREKAGRTIFQEGGEAVGMQIERMVQSEEGRALLASYCRMYTR